MMQKLFKHAYYRCERRYNQRYLDDIRCLFFSLENTSLKKTLTLLIIFTMFFSGELISFYLTVKNLGLMNNFPALILPTAINTFNMIIMRTDFAWLPKLLEESATIDGANDFIILFRIILPIALPTVAVIILYYGVGP